MERSKSHQNQSIAAVINQRIMLTTKTEIATLQMKTRMFTFALISKTKAYNCQVIQSSRMVTLRSIEVSIDGKKYDEVNHHSNDSNNIGTFKVIKEQTEFYCFIRLCQTGYSWG